MTKDKLSLWPLATICILNYFLTFEVKQMEFPKCGTLTSSPTWDLEAHGYGQISIPVDFLCGL